MIFPEPAKSFESDRIRIHNTGSYGQFVYGTHNFLTYVFTEDGLRALTLLPRPPQQKKLHKELWSSKITEVRLSILSNLCKQTYSSVP
jgi:hypothetical protein